MDVDTPPLVGHLKNRFGPVALSIVLPLTGIVLSEVALFHGSVVISLWGHFLTLLLCVFAPLIVRLDIRMLQAIVLVPLFRIVTLGMPVVVDFTLYWLVTIYAPLFFALIVLLRTQDDLSIEPPLTLRSFGTRLLLLPIALAGAVLLSEVEFHIIGPEALIAEWTTWNLVLIAVVMIGFVGFVEEMLFRGILQRRLQTRIGRWSGILLASGVFGLLHSVYGTELGILFAFAVGILLGLLYDWTDSIGLVTIVHGVMNVFLFAVIPMHGPVLGIV